MRSGRFFWGLLLMGIGILSLASYLLSYFKLTMGSLWPFYILILGLCFELNYFLTSKNAWSVIPGGVLITTGLISFAEVVFNHWHYAEYTWPVYLLVPLAGLGQFYYFSGKNKRLLIPIYILTAIAIISAGISLLTAFSNHHLTTLIIAAIFLISGLFILLRKPVAGKQ